MSAEDNDAASVAESDDVSVATEDDFRDGVQDGDSVQVYAFPAAMAVTAAAVSFAATDAVWAGSQVFVRVRPINSAEAAEGKQSSACSDTAVNGQSR